MKKYKIDLFISEQPRSFNSAKTYVGSIILSTAKDDKWVFGFLHHAGRNMAIEGIQITTFQFDSYTLIELTDFLRNGDFFTEIILESEEFEIIDAPLTDETFTDDGESEYLIIGDDAVAELYTEKDFEFLKDQKIKVAKSEYLYEWGNTGFWVNYTVGIASSLTVLLIDKLILMKFPLDSLKKFKLPSNIKKSIGKEYNIDPKTLFLERYLRDEESGIENVCFRNTEYRIFLKIKNSELIELTTEKLRKYIAKKKNNQV